MILLVVVGVLHATGLLVHVQAFLQRGVLLTGLFRAEEIPESERTGLPGGLVFVGADGTPVHLDSLRGEVLFVNLWASWCPPCLAEMPAIDRLYRSHGDRIRFFLVTLDDDPATGYDHVRSAGFAFPAYRPGSPLPGSLYRGVLPTTWVVDRQGRLAVLRQGMARYDSRGFRRTLDALAGDVP